LHRRREPILVATIQTTSNFDNHPKSLRLVFESGVDLEICSDQRFHACPNTARRLAAYQALCSALPESFWFDGGYRFYCGDQRSLCPPRPCRFLKNDWFLLVGSTASQTLLIESHSANTCQIDSVFVRFHARLFAIDKIAKRADLPSKMAIFEVPMMGVEPIPRFSRERILSPLRLPFRHIGTGACILSSF